MKMVPRRAQYQRLLLPLLALTALLCVSQAARAQTNADRPFTLAASTGAVEEDDLTRVDLTNFVVGLKAGQTGTVRVRYNVTAVGGVAAFNPAAFIAVRVRYRDSDGAGAAARVSFTIRRTNILTGGNTAIYTFDSNLLAGAGTLFTTQTDCASGADFDFASNVYWIEAELSRSDAAQLANLGSIQIFEASASCP